MGKMSNGRATNGAHNNETQTLPDLRELTASQRREIGVVQPEAPEPLDTCWKDVGPNPLRRPAPAVPARFSEFGIGTRGSVNSSEE